MNSKLSSFAVAAIASLGMAATIAPAAHADSPDAQINVQVSDSLPAVGENVTYNYGITYQSDGADYTTQILQQQANGNYSPYTALQTTQLNSQPGSTSGSGAFTIPDTSRYEIEVVYYAKGQTTSEDRADIVIKPHAAPVATPTPTPAPTPAPAPIATVPVASTPTPVATPVAPTVAPVVAPVATPVVPTTKPKGTEHKAPKAKPVVKAAPKPIVKAKLTITKHAARPVYTAGSVSTWTIKVGDSSKTTAQNVVMCDTLPTGTQFDSASRPVSFTGDRACFKLGSIAHAQVKSVTIKLLIAANTHQTQIINHAGATASNAPSVKAQASVRIPRRAVPTTPAPVTG
jgi:uncharacterized repeat protein (TIGR01451 family)